MSDIVVDDFDEKDNDCREDQKCFLCEADLKNLSSFLVVICDD